MMWLGHVLRAGLLIFLAVNLYAVALRFVPVPTTILMVQRGLSGEDVRRDWTRLEDISPYMVQAVMGGEDSRFCQHDGIDWAAIEQAFEENQEGGRRRGGSTITQQTAKNVFFWNGGGYMRKAGEAWFASLIDFTWGKPRVMEVYLNVAPTEFVQSRAGILRQRMKTIQNSGYSNCITGLEPRKAVPSKETVKEPVEPEPIPQVTLEEVLDAAEDSLKEKEIEMPDTEPKPKPNEIPPVDPSTIPHDPETVPPFPVPEFPDDMPQEVPPQSPPAETPPPDES